MSAGELCYKWQWRESRAITARHWEFHPAAHDDPDAPGARYQGPAAGAGTPSPPPTWIPAPLVGSAKTGSEVCAGARRTYSKTARHNAHADLPPQAVDGALC